MEFLIFGILIGLIFFTTSKIYKFKIEKEKIRCREEIYNKEKGEIEKQVQQDLVSLYDKVDEVRKEIRDKTEFNESLKQIREDELDRLIETQKIEKEKTLEEKVRNWAKEQFACASQELDEFKNSQLVEKKKLSEEISQIQSSLKDFKKQREAVNQAILREREIAEKDSFFRIVIPQCDIDDIEILKTIELKLTNREALHRLIYDVFIKRPLDELIKRVIDNSNLCGIYKITYLKTGESYIGKSTNIPNRWKNHVKTACGLDGAASSTFHTRLENDGVWNYSFEILEFTEKEKLSDKEKFYIDLYQTHTQLNMKRG